MIRIAEVIVVASLLLGGCVATDSLDIGGERVVISDPQMKQDLKGQRVVDMTGVQPYPIWESWSPEIEERIAAGGERVASRLCAGPVDLVSVTRRVWGARTADVRFRCT